MSGKLREIRDRIDALDDRIVELLDERARLAQSVGHAKRDDVKFRPEREAQVQRRLAAKVKSFPRSALAHVYTEIISACRALEADMAVAYLGPRGTFSEEAAQRRFGRSAGYTPEASLDAVFSAVESGRAGYGVVPVENSTEGSVGITHDLLLSTPLKICGEVLLPVHHCLMSKGGDLGKVKKVLSHAQSLAQCHEWLGRHLPRAKREPAVSNAEAARLAARDPAAAAIASQAAAELYKLKVIAANIEDNPQNTTRFLVLAAHDAAPSGRDKTSIVLATRNAPGAVHELLTPLARHGVSMTRFESRPARTGRWEYVFYMDLEGHAADERVAQALAELQQKAAMFKNLGSYPAADA